MSVDLDDYREQLGEMSIETQGILRAAWGDAARVLTPQGLDNYLRGAVAIRGLGKGDSLVATWIEQAPQVAREVGEGVIPDLATAALNFAAKTSGAVIDRLLATAPMAANRLSDADLFRKYLQFLDNLLAQAPRGVRPLLENLEELFSQLTLGGLRRWAMWGAHTHRTNYAEQVNYFSIATKESQAILQKERKGTLFVDVQRRINMYLRALWGRDFFMRPTSGDYETREGMRPFIQEHLLYLPDAYDDTVSSDGFGRLVSGVELYRAASAHCAAHLVATRLPISAEGLNPLQMAVIALIEDARVEAIAIARFPGLRELWAQFHTATPRLSGTVGDYLSRLARALLDDSYQDDDAWVVQGRTLFRQARDLGRLEGLGATGHISWEIGVVLAHALQIQVVKGMHIPFNLRSDVQSAVYRDDNRYFWAFDGFGFEEAAQTGFETKQQVRKYVSALEMANEVDCELAGDDADEIWMLATPFYLDQEGCTINELEGREPVSQPYHYPEWDYQIQLERPAWVTVLEKRPERGDLERIELIAEQYQREIRRMKYLLDAMQPHGVVRMRKLEDGDEIDINAAILGMTDIRQGRQPDTRIMMRSVRNTRDFAILVLLDLSESTNDVVHGQDISVLDLTCQSCVLLADSIHRVGDPFAIHGFCSDGRHDVAYYRFKDFEAPWDDKAKARLAGMKGALSTRMGAAIRHAGHYLWLQKAAKKLLIVITDGEPADVDVRDPQYLRFDAKKAVEEVAKRGVATYCMSLDVRADNYVSRIFGQTRYTVVDRVERLPEKLPLLYAGLTR